MREISCKNSERLLRKMAKNFRGYFFLPHTVEIRTHTKETQIIKNTHIGLKIRYKSIQINTNQYKSIFTNHYAANIFRLDNFFNIIDSVPQLNYVQWIIIPLHIGDPRRT